MKILLWVLVGLVIVVVLRAIGVTLRLFTPSILSAQWEWIPIANPTSNRFDDPHDKRVPPRKLMTVGTWFNFLCFVGYVSWTFLWEDLHHHRGWKFNKLYMLRGVRLEQFPEPDKLAEEAAEKEKRAKELLENAKESVQARASRLRREKNSRRRAAISAGDSE